MWENCSVILQACSNHSVISTTWLFRITALPRFTVNLFVVVRLASAISSVTTLPTRGHEPCCCIRGYDWRAAYSADRQRFAQWPRAGQILASRRDRVKGSLAVAKENEKPPKLSGRAISASDMVPTSLVYFRLRRRIDIGNLSPIVLEQQFRAIWVRQHSGERLISCTREKVRS